MKNALSRFWRAWKRLGQFIGDLIGRLVLTIFYFTIFLPFGLGVRLFGDRLGIKNGLKPKWVRRETLDCTLDDARRLS